MKFNKKSGLAAIRLLTVLLWVLCTALLLLPKPWILFWNHNIPEELGFGLGVEHLYMFGTLGCFVELSRRKWQPFTWLHILAAYGLATEVLQHFVTPRTCDIHDLCQDCAGAYLGVIIGFGVKWIYNWFTKRPKYYVPKRKKTVSEPKSYSKFFR